MAPHVEVKAPEHSGSTNFSHSLSDIEDERLRGMLQALLVDRFQLRVRRETRTGDFYQLMRTTDEAPVYSGPEHAASFMRMLGMSVLS